MCVSLAAEEKQTAFDKFHPVETKRASEAIFEQVKAAYPDCFSCVCRIEDYFRQKFQVQITKEEQMYLMLHIGRVVHRERNRKTKENHD